MTPRKEDWEIELWARGVRGRWWRAALAPLGDMLSAAGRALLHRLRERRIRLAAYRRVRRQGLGL